MASPITTRIHVHNTIQHPTSNKVLMFLRPVEASDNYLFSAWNVLNPGPGSSQQVDLTTSFSASIAQWADSHGSYTDPVALPLGQAVTVTDLNGQSATIDTGNIYGPLTPDQVGLYNDATTPPTDLSVTWWVNGNKVVETNNTAATTLNPGFTSTFQLKQSVYLMFGQAPTVTQTYTLQTFSQAVEIPVPNGATDLYIEAYTDASGIDTFKAVSQGEFLARESADEAAQRHGQSAAAGVTGRQTAADIRVAPLGGGVPAPAFTGEGEVTTNMAGAVTRLSARAFAAGSVPMVGTQYRITYNRLDGTGQHTQIMTCTQNGSLSIFV